MVIGRAEFTMGGQYERWRIRSPQQFIPNSFRTHDFGKTGYSKRIAGRLRATGKWATQSILISRAEPEFMKRQLRRQAKDMIRRR